MTEHEELLMLRELVEEKNIALIKKDEELAKKDKIIEQQNIRIENMIQSLLHARKKLFGASSEVTKQIEGQINLFESNEELAKALFGEQKKITVPSHTRVARQAGVRAEMLEGIPKEIIEYVINPEEVCGKCGSPLKVIGKKMVRTDVEFVPAKIVVTQHVQQVAKCTECGTDKSDNPKDYFKKAAVPTPVLPHSIATASSVAQVMYQKFMLGVPLSRQEKDWMQLGLVLPRNNMANWVIRCSQEWLTPIYHRIHKELLKCECLHMDETRIQCNKEEGKKASSDSFMWVMRSGTSEAITATFFHYSRTRSGDVAKKLLEGYHNYLTTDAYIGYEKADNLKRNLCWSHARRYFIDSIPLDNKGKEITGSKGAEGREFINLLFKIEDDIRELPFEEKKDKRQEASRAILDAFWTWVEETSAMNTTNEKLRQALTYVTNQRKYLETFLKNGKLPISNNYCEAGLRPFATARRAWLFADTPKGATANAVLYTLVETAKANELNIYNYLKFLLEKMPNTDFHNHPELIERYMPWSEELPDDCRLIRKVRKQSR
jgi:transposase